MTDQPAASGPSFDLQAEMEAARKQERAEFEEIWAAWEVGPEVAAQKEAIFVGFQTGLSYGLRLASERVDDLKVYAYQEGYRARGAADAAELERRAQEVTTDFADSHGDRYLLGASEYLTEAARALREMEGG